MRTSALGVARPRVFISSTIRDLQDLRSALRYWLESAGYDVQLSEYNDFDREPEAHTFEACFGNVVTSEYYILLMGRERGSWYKEDERVTVTRQEFRVANQAAQARPLRIIVFVREEVVTALKQWRDDGRPPSASSVLADPTFTDEFLQEVEKQVDDEDSRGSRWRYTFGDFRDIVDTLRVILRLSTNIQHRLLQDNVLGELLYDLSLLVTRTKGKSIFPKHWWVGSVRRQIVIQREDIGGQVWLMSEQIGRLGLLAFTNPRKELRLEAVAEALKQGLYLEIDPRTGDFAPTEAQEALQALYDDMLSLMSLADSEPTKKILMEFAVLARRANRGELGSGASVEADTLTVVLGLHDRMETVFEGIAQLAQWILGAADSPTIQRKPFSPIEGMGEAIKAEQVTIAELRQALTDGIRPFGAQLTPEMQELLGRKAKDVADVLRSLMPDDVVPDDAIADVAREVLEELVKERFEGETDHASGDPGGSSS